MSFPHYYDMLRHYTRDALQAKIHLIGHQEAFWQTNLSRNLFGKRISAKRKTDYSIWSNPQGELGNCLGQAEDL